MSSPPRATSFALSDTDAQRLERHLRADETRVRQALAERAFAGPVCALAFVYVGQEPLALATYVCALTEATREAAFERHGEQALWKLWFAPDWDHVDVLAGASAGSIDEAGYVANRLKRAGCGNPEGAFVSELAYRLARLDWSDVMETSSDFACWASDHEGTAVVLDNFRATAPSAVIAVFEERSWLRFPDEFALEQ